MLMGDTFRDARPPDWFPECALDLFDALFVVLLGCIAVYSIAQEDFADQAHGLGSARLMPDCSTSVVVVDSGPLLEVISQI